MNKRYLLGLLLWPLAAAAEGDYAWQWPLQLSEQGAGVYEITLSDEVYRAAYWRDLRDVRVLDADGRMVESAIYPAPDVSISNIVKLAWFALPAEVRADADLELAVQRDASGRVMAIRETSTTSASVAAPAWLIDLGEHQGRVRAIRVEWTDLEARFDLGYRVEGSDDLRHWRVLERNVRLVQLRNDQHHLRRDDFILSASAQPRYLRMTPLQPEGVPVLKALYGGLVHTTPDDDGQWLQLTARPTADHDGFEYHLPGAFPIQRLDVELAANSSITWSVSSRSLSVLPNELPGPWRSHALRWETWNVQMAGQPQRSPPLELPTLGDRDRDWRLQPATGTLPPVAPILRLGWRPERLAFLAQGRAPYRLVAGHAGAEQDRSHGMGVHVLRDTASANGAPWLPDMARLGARQMLAGDAAYQPPPELPIPRDWKTWMLWGVLIVGSVIVAGFAMSVLRARPTPDTGEDSGQ